MFFTNLQEYSMHKSVIVLSILFLGFDLSAVKHVQNSEARRLAALGIDYEGFSFAKKKRESFDSARPIKFGLEKYLLKQCKELELQNRQLERENDALRSKLAVSPEELSKGESSNSDPEKFSLNSGSSSNGASPLTIIVSSSSSPIAIVRSLAKGKEEDRFTPQDSAIPVCDSPCGFWMSHLPGMSSSSSFPGSGSFLLSSAVSNKNISSLAPYPDDCP